MVTIDNTKNINRIIAKIKADTNLYDSGKTKGKLRDVTFGDPENNDKMSVPQLPYLYVTTMSSLQTTRRDIGITSSENARQLNVQYELVIVAKSDARSSDAQKQIYDIIKNLITLTQADPKFTDPDTSLDPIFSRSVISDIPYEEATRGKLLISVSIILLATIGEAFSLDISGFTDIPLIGKPIEREIETTEDIFNTARERKGTSPISEIHSFFAVMQYDSAVLAALRTSKRARAVISATLHRPTSNESFNGKITEVLNGTANFDDIETVSIRF